MPQKKHDPFIVLRNYLYRRYKVAAKLRDYPWELSKGAFTELISGDCEYCGDPPRETTRKIRRKKYDVGSKHSHSFYTAEINGVDRVNNDEGYTKENCVSCCTKCNFMKHALTVEVFLEHVEKIYQHSMDTK